MQNVRLVSFYALRFQCQVFAIMYEYGKYQEDGFLLNSKGKILVAKDALTLSKFINSADLNEINQINFLTTVSSDTSVEEWDALIEFINLFGDYAHQWQGYRKLQNMYYDPFIQRAWNYFYTYIFWPRFNDPQKFATWQRPTLSINYLKLSKRLLRMRGIFERNLVLIH